MDEIQHNCQSRDDDLTARSDTLILVDAADHRVGSLDKASCHEGRGILHRAFSALIFNSSGELLIQQRAASKRLWPSYWSNSCCSHPRVGETMDVATQRRLREELGVTCPLQYLFKFEYQAQFDPTGAEHELCSVFIGRAVGPIVINHEEIRAWRWIGPEELQNEMTVLGVQKFTPWFMIEWQRILSEHWNSVLTLQSQN